jgi:hypothetical protein
MIQKEARRKGEKAVQQFSKPPCRSLAVLPSSLLKMPSCRDKKSAHREALHAPDLDRAKECPYGGGIGTEELEGERDELVFAVVHTPEIEVFDVEGAGGEEGFVDLEGGAGAGVYGRGVHTEEAEATVEEDAQRGVAERGPGIGKGAGSDRAAAAKEESFDRAGGERSELGGLDHRMRRVDSEHDGASQERIQREVV